MKKPIINNIGFKAIIVAFVLMFFANVGAKAYCDFYTQNGFGGNYMALNFVKFDGNVIQRWDVPRDGDGNIYWYYYPVNFYGYKDVDWNNQIMYAEKNKDYTMFVVSGAGDLYEDDNNPYDENANYEGYYPMDIKAYIDFNQDGEFDESTELAGQYDNGGGDFEEEFQIYIPKEAKSGQTTMRIVCDYYPQYGAFDACNSYYGEAKDFIIEIKAGIDIGISQITSPASPLSAGVKPVKAILKNYSEEMAVYKCTIRWTVDGVSQTPVNWTGTLGALQQQEVTLGNYNFASKGALTVYSISATTEYPNDKDDGNTNNDTSPAYLATMPIPSGIYYVGGTGYDFLTLKAATEIINAAGLTGDGNVTVRIRPGTYAGPFILDNFPHGNNNLIFERDPATTGDVNITAATNSSNYVWYINNVPNVTFRNLIFNVTNPQSYGGRIFMIRGNANNFAFENNTFNGLNVSDQTPYKYTIIDCQASQMNNNRYYKNTFNYANMSLVLINSTRNSSGLLVDQNTFNSFTNSAIQVDGIAGGVISNNTLKASSRASYGGIIVHNGTTIINNNISGLIGINTSAAAITVVDDVVSSPAIITGNSITGGNRSNGISASGIAGGTINKNTIDLINSNLTSATSGIVLSNTTLGTDKVVISENVISMENGFGINIVNFPVDILRNKITTGDASSKVNLKSISATGSTGMILMNELISYGEALEIDNSYITIAYNSTLCLGSADVLTMEDGHNQVYRNNFINLGTGNAFAIIDLNSNVLDGNNYVTKTGILGTIDGTTYTSAAQLLAIDKNARSYDPTYKTNTNLKINEFKDELVFNYPLANINWPQGYQAAYEETAMDGMNRNGTYYIGAYIVIPTLEIIGYSDGLIDCSYAPDRNIYVSAGTSTGQEATYQWYKDGVALQGENTHILNFEPFDYSVSATYTCRVYCPGAGTQFTGTIPVYALTTPAIVEQPQEVINAVVGNDYSFNVHVHYHGLIPPYYKDYFQWYKYTAAKKDSTPLKNDSRFAGATSSDFTITNLKDADICKPGDFYYVKVEGQCGTVYSDPFVISKAAEVIFRDHPANLNPCPGADVVFIANAIAPQGFTLTYKWMKDGVDLTNDLKYNGVNTNKLQIFDVQVNDLGKYVCVATIPEVPTSKNSNAGILTLKDIPQANPVGDANITTKRGTTVSMIVDLVKGAEPLTVKWYYNGELFKEGLWSVYDGDKLLTILLEGVNEDQSGEYKCILENECNQTEVIFNLTVTKWDETNSVEVISENGYSLYTCMPNPTNGSTKIRFEMPQTDNAVITLVDQTGRTVSVLFNGVANKGMNVLDVNTNSLNVASGVYLYMITTNGFNASLPMVIVK